MLSIPSSRPISWTDYITLLVDFVRPGGTRAEARTVAKAYIDAATTQLQGDNDIPPTIAKSSLRDQELASLLAATAILFHGVAVTAEDPVPREDTRDSKHMAAAILIQAQVEGLMLHDTPWELFDPASGCGLFSRTKDFACHLGRESLRMVARDEVNLAERMTCNYRRRGLSDDDVRLELRRLFSATLATPCLERLIKILSLPRARTLGSKEIEKISRECASWGCELLHLCEPAQAPALEALMRRMAPFIRRYSPQDAMDALHAAITRLLERLQACPPTGEEEVIDDHC